MGPLLDSIGEQLFVAAVATLPPTWESPVESVSMLPLGGVMRRYISIAESLNFPSDPKRGPWGRRKFLAAMLGFGLIDRMQFECSHE